MATNEADKWFEQYIIDRWERLRRHPDYRTFCRKYSKYFNDGILVVGIVYNYDAQNPSEALKALEAENALDEHYALEAQKAMEAQNALEVIKKQFDLDTVYHYDLDFTAAEMWASPPIFNNSLAVTPQWDRTEVDDETTEFSLVRDEHYIDCKINISPDISLESIKAEIAGLVKYARSETAEKDNRQRFDSNLIAYQVYDQRMNHVPFSDISRKLGITVEAARQKFRRAWQLICGEEYNPEHLPNLLQRHFAEQGQWDRFQELDSPRNEVLAYADKDGRLPVIDEYSGNSMSAMKELCRGCGDTECSQVMFNIYDELKEEGIPNLGDFEPCPDLIKLIRDLMDPKTRKSRALPRPD